MRQKWKGFLFRLLAILLGLLPILLIEIGLRCLNWPTNDAANLQRDPFVGFAGVSPLFRLNGNTERWEIDPSRLTFFRPDSFVANKSAKHRRIFCLGGSTVQGRPYACETAFTTWLRLALETAEPNWQWEVVNCGGVSYASYRLAPILNEVLTHQPDLIILLTGHNEFLEARSYPFLRQTPSWVGRGFGGLRSLYLYRAITHFIAPKTRAPELPTAPATAAPTELPAEVTALLDYRGGLEKYQFDPVWQKDVREHFASTLRRMIQHCQDAGVPLIVCLPPVNLRDCPPFKSGGPPLATEALAARDRHWSQARASYRNNPLQARQELILARHFDPWHAGLIYDSAKVAEACQLYQEARTLYQLAVDRDLCPLRLTAPLEDTLRQVTQELNCATVDIASHFAATSPAGIVGAHWLIDHVHPTIEGHQEIARLLLPKVCQFLQLSHPHKEQFGQAVEQVWTSHLDSLPALYFAEGDRRLTNLRLWAAGRATLPMPE